MEELHPISLYVWNPPEAAVTIHISLEVIERIRALLERQPTETLGILRGAVLLTATGVVVVADDFVQARDETQLRASVSLPSVVGCWRAQADAALEPSNADRNRMARYFRQPWKVLLLIQPKEERGGTAAFFTWREGALAGGSGGEFPFHSDTLVAEGRLVIEGPRRSKAVELRESHRWRVSAATAMVVATAVAGGAYLSNPPFRHAPAVSSRAVPQLGDRLIEADTHVGRPQPETRSPSVDVRKPPASPIPQFTLNVAGPRPQRRISKPSLKRARMERTLQRRADEGGPRVLVRTTRDFPRTSPTSATLAPAPVHDFERPATEVGKAEPLRKPADMIGAAHPAGTALGWLRRGTLRPLGAVGRLFSRLVKHGGRNAERVP